MSSRNSVLFLTNSEYGQANVVLAVTHELLATNKLDIHVASWPVLEARIQALTRQQSKSGVIPETSQIKFHAIPGLGMLDATFKNYNVSKDSLPHKPGYEGGARFRELAPQVLACWTPEEHLAMVDWFEDLAMTLKPALVVVDPFLSPAHDMVKKLNWKHVVLSPCSLAAALIPEQPHLAAFWKYPWYVSFIGLLQNN
jgi:hypothetical protein